MTTPIHYSIDNRLRWFTSREHLSSEENGDSAHGQRFQSRITSGLYPARREIATGHIAARAGSQSVEQTALGLWVLYGAKVVSEHARAVGLVARDGYYAARNAKNLSGVWYFGVG